MLPIQPQPSPSGCPAAHSDLSRSTSQFQTALKRLLLTSTVLGIARQSNEMGESDAGRGYRGG